MVTNGVEILLGPSDEAEEGVWRNPDGSVPFALSWPNKTLDNYNTDEGEPESPLEYILSGHV